MSAHEIASSYRCFQNCVYLLLYWHFWGIKGLTSTISSFNHTHRNLEGIKGSPKNQAKNLSLGRSKRYTSSRLHKYLYTFRTLKWSPCVYAASALSFCSNCCRKVPSRIRPPPEMLSKHGSWKKEDILTRNPSYRRKLSDGSCFNSGGKFDISGVRGRAF